MELNKREQVKALIEKGGMTKAAIAAALSMSPSSVSTQMTYLRWMDHYIITDPETKVLSFTDKETYEAMQAEKKANTKTKAAAARTPAERLADLQKTIGTQRTALTKWETKVKSISEIVTEHPNDVDAQMDLEEAKAQVTLLKIKISRNEALADTLSAGEETAEDAEAANEATEDESAESDTDDDLL